MKLIPPSKVEIKDSPGKGLGVFSMKKIFKGEIIEECPLFTLKKGETIKEFHNYVFNYPQGFTNTEIVLPWGFGCIYNHSDDNNAYWIHLLSINIYYRYTWLSLFTMLVVTY